MTNPNNENNQPIVRNGIPDTSNETSQTLKGGVSFDKKVALYVPSGHSFDSESLEGVAEIIVYDPSTFSLDNLPEGITEIRIIPSDDKDYSNIEDMGTASGAINTLVQNFSKNTKIVRAANTLGKVPVISFLFETVEDTLAGWNDDKDLYIEKDRFDEMQRKIDSYKDRIEIVQGAVCC